MFGQELRILDCQQINSLVLIYISFLYVVFGYIQSLLNVKQSVKFEIKINQTKVD